MKFRHNYRVVHFSDGWWYGEIRYWWWPFWITLEETCATSSDSSILHVKSIVEQKAKPHHVPTIINLGKLP